MPLVTAAPVLIDAVAFSRQGGAEFNPMLFLIGGNLYAMLLNQVDGKSWGVFESTDGGHNWTHLDSANDPVASGVGQPFSDGTNLFLVWQDAVTHNVVIQKFTIGANTWGAASAALAVGANTDGFLGFVQSGGAIVILYTTGNGTSGIKGVIQTAGVWGAPATLIVGTNHLFAGVIDGTDRILLNYENAATDLVYSLLSVALAVSDTTTVAAAGTWDITATDIILFGTGFAIGYTDTQTIVKVARSASITAPVFTTDSIVTVPNTGNVSYPKFIIDRSGKLNVFWSWQDQTTLPITDEEDMSTFDGAIWGAKVQFYDETTNPPPNSDIPTNQFVHTGQGFALGNGTFVFITAMETLQPQSRCTGFALVSNPPAPSSFVPEFPSNPLPPPPFCAINEMVIGRVTTNGVDTSIVITDNMAVSTADLARGLPTVEFEPLDANFGAIGPFVQAITSSTVTIGFAAVAGTFRVRIDKINTMLR